MMDSHPVLTAIRHRRSVRAFTDAPVTREAVLSILEAGRWAPSGLNNQPWRMLVLFPGDGRLNPLAGCTKYCPILHKAGAIICVFLAREAIYNAMKDHQGAGACIQNMLLAAHSLGLGAVWLGEIVNQSEQAMLALGLDNAQYELQAVLAVGHPKHPGASSRKPLSELLIEEMRP